MAEIATLLIQLVHASSASVDEQREALQEKIDGLKSGLSTDTVVQPALEGLTPQQWDVIGAIITTRLQPEPEPAEAGPSPDLTSSSYEEVSPKNPIYDQLQWGTQTKSENANEEALQNADEQALLIQQQKSQTGKEQALEEKTLKDDTFDALDLSSAYEEVSREDQFDPSDYVALNPQLQPLTDADKVGNNEIQHSLSDLQEADALASSTAKKLAESQTHKDGLDLSSAYEEVSRGDSVIDSVYGQIQGAAPPKVDPTQYPPDLGSPGSGEEFPDGNANGIPGEYGDGPDLDANGVPDEIGINPDSLQPGYPNSPWASSLDPALFDPTEPGPTLDPSLFDPTSPGPTLDPSLFDPHLPGLTLDPALLDPTEPGPTLDPSQLDPSAPGPTLDLQQLEEHGVAIPPEDFTYQSQTYSPAHEDPGSASQEDVPEHEDFFESV